MTDIVQQLRQRDGDWLCEKAANEIERLWKRVAELERMEDERESREGWLGISALNIHKRGESDD